MPTDPACVFCKIATGIIPARRVMETDHVLAFLDAAPLAPGHTLLIPKDHYSSMGDAPTEVLARLSAVLPRLSTAIVQATGAAGFNLLQNNGSVAGQVVMHLHFHLIPRREGDGLGYRWKPMKADSARDDAITEHIRSAGLET